MWLHSNMKPEEVQGRTKQLEDESRRMEDRLRELKLAMNREKELREWVLYAAVKRFCLIYEPPL